MSQQLLPESPEKSKQRVEGRPASPNSALSFQHGTHPIGQLQRSLGNRKVAQLIQARRLSLDGSITGIQKKLTVGAADDSYEQEADRVARQVMNTTDAKVAAAAEQAHSSARFETQMLQPKLLAASITPITQRRSGTGNDVENDQEKDAEEENDESFQTNSFSNSAEHSLQRQTTEEEESPIQTKSIAPLTAAFAAGTDVETQLSLSKGRGSPLPDTVRAFMEPRFGADFSQVRIHTGNEAQQMNQAVGAQAFTHGNDIYFGAGRNPAHLELTAHELTHVVQQTGRLPLQSKRQSEMALDNDAFSIQRIPAAFGEIKIARKEAIPMTGNLTGKEDKPAAKTSAAPQQPVEAEKSSAPNVKPENKAPPPFNEGSSKKEVSETTSGKESLQPPATHDKAPASPEEDSAYQVVVDQLRTTATEEKTPTKEPEKKQQETQFAANLTPAEIDRQNAYGNHLDNLEQAQPPELTAEKFLSDFNRAIENLAGKLPENKEQHNTVQTAVELGVEKAKVVGELGVRNQTFSGPLRATAAKNTSDFQDNKQESATYELKADPAGALPAIDNAKTAAPKPKTNDEISLDDKSRDLDEVLLNHEVQGQTLNIEESSLAFPISGEKTFDEAGEAKRKAQDEIAKVKPRYRESEKELIGESQTEIQSLVHSGLQNQHNFRSNSFNKVLAAQNSHESKIEAKKRAVLNEYQGIYEETKVNVQKELDRLTGIEDTFQNIINEAEKYFNHLVENDLEYIYTPGILDYSDWKDKHEDEIKEEFEKQKRLIGDEDVWAKSNAYAKALRIVQDRSAEKLFSTAKKIFINDVVSGVRDKIAQKVVNALNAAKKHIKDGKDKVKKAFDALAPEEQQEIENVLVSVTGQFENLEESVDDRQREIIADMAKTYNQSVGKLQATFDAIKKDVLTSWFEKAWNKLKAIVNAIIDFASKIAELLGRLIYLVGDIVSSPRAFFNNLATGIGQGFSTFVDRIDEFLATAFFDWLRGSSGLPIQLPNSWEPKGIFSLFTQLLNLGVETIWERMEVVYDKTTANAFRRGEILLDKGLEIFGIIKTEGLGGLWTHIKESLGNILEETLDMIKETVLYAAIKKAIVEIGKLIIPGGGFIAIAEKVIRFLQFIVEARDKILNLIESFVDSVEMAVKGNVPGIVKHITGALGKFITVALDFLVTFFGLGNLKEKVERFIERMRKPVIRGIDWVLGKFKSLVMKGKEKVIGAGKAIVQVGVPEDPRKRLDEGVKAGVIVVNKLPGKRVKETVISPLLSILKTRYRLQSLEAILQNGKWAVKGVVNPVKIELTAKEKQEQEQQKDQFIETFKPAFGGDEGQAKAFLTELSSSYDHDAVVSLQAAVKAGQSATEIVKLIGAAKPAFKIEKEIFSDSLNSIYLHYKGVAIYKGKLITDFDTKERKREPPGEAMVIEKSLKLDFIIPPPVKAMGVKGVGKEMFNLAFKHFQDDIESISATWLVGAEYKPGGGLSDNLKLFILNYPRASTGNERSRDNRKAAAKATWTAEMAGRKDYDILKAKDVEIEGGVGVGMRYDPDEQNFVEAGNKYGIKSVKATFRKKPLKRPPKSEQ